MRLLGILPLLLCIVALVLTFLCIFAGSSKGFMESYALITLNSSGIGQDILYDSYSSSNIVLSYIANVTNNLTGSLNHDVHSLAQDLGLHDFYSGHILNFCEGDYLPPSPSRAPHLATAGRENVTYCATRTVAYTFDPTVILQGELVAAGSHINLTQLGWPSAILDKGRYYIRLASVATFILYCVAVATISAAAGLALIALFSQPRGRLGSVVNLVVGGLALSAVGLASMLVTVIIDDGTGVVNAYGGSVGVSAKKGGKFLALTWLATVAMFVVSGMWGRDYILQRRMRKNLQVPKY